LKVNEAITSPQVRVVSHDGNMLGVFTKEQAVAIAREAGLDLVEVSPGADPPVCKVLDFGRFKYAQRKRDKESRKKSHAHEQKEIRFRPKTDTNDLNRKLDHARELLGEGYRLQLTMRLRGREMAYKELAAELLMDAVEALADCATLESQGAEGRQIIAMLAPKKQSKSKKTSERSETDEQKDAQSGGEETEGDAEGQDKAPPDG
jgi:translation initiation factor IF-3